MRRWSEGSEARSGTSARASRSTARRALLTAAGVLATVWCTAAIAQGRPVLDGLAQVLEDGSLLINGRNVRLYGLYIPVDERTCRRYLRPARCDSKAVLVLDERVTGFVRCEIVGGDGGDRLAGICTVKNRDLFGPGVDLGASLVADGWALAGADAPPQYVALERLARAREAGLWSDRITNFR